MASQSFPVPQGYEPAPACLIGGGPCKHLLSLSVTHTFVLCCSGVKGSRSELCASILQTAGTVQNSSCLLKMLRYHSFTLILSNKD